MSDRAEILCLDCGIADWVNPIEDHAEWTGHRWNPSLYPMTWDDYLSWVRAMHADF